MADVSLPLALDEIEIPDGRRAINPAAVKKLAASIEEVGLRHPITVRQRGERYILVAGRHRLEAFRKLGKEHIAAIISSFTKLQAELWEIDENLCRSDLTPAEEAAAVARRKAIYEELYPKTKHGGNQTPSGQFGHTEEQSFVESTANATGKSDRSVRRATARGEEITPATLDKIVGTSLDKGDELDALGRLSEPQRDALIDRAVGGEKVSAKTEFKKEQRDNRERVLGACQQSLPTKKYGVILADPEWRFEPWSRTSGMDRAADNHYPTSCTEVIAARDVPSIAADDCVLFLWATVPMLPQALIVMGAWGFDYKSHIVWLKDRIGTGYWFRNEHELLLLGTKGNIPAPAPGTQWRSVEASNVRAHSEKPDVFLGLIEQYFPTLPKIELNRRGPPRDGWDAWGNESEEAAA